MNLNLNLQEELKFAKEELFKMANIQRIQSSQLDAAKSELMDVLQTMTIMESELLDLRTCLNNMEQMRLSSNNKNAAYHYNDSNNHDNNMQSSRDELCSMPFRKTIQVISKCREEEKQIFRSRIDEVNHQNYYYSQQIQYLLKHIMGISPMSSDEINDIFDSTILLKNQGEIQPRPLRRHHNNQNQNQNQNYNQQEEEQELKQHQRKANLKVLSSAANDEDCLKELSNIFSLTSSSNVSYLSSKVSSTSSAAILSSPSVKHDTSAIVNGNNGNNNNSNDNNNNNNNNNDNDNNNNNINKNILLFPSSSSTSNISSSSSMTSFLLQEDVTNLNIKQQQHDDSIFQLTLQAATLERDKEEQLLMMQKTHNTQIENLCDRIQYLENKNRELEEITKIHSSMEEELEYISQSNRSIEDMKVVVSFLSEENQLLKNQVEELTRFTNQAIHEEKQRRTDTMEKEQNYKLKYEELKQNLMKSTVILDQTKLDVERTRAKLIQVETENFELIRSKMALVEAFQNYSTTKH